jgi:hypothetical protein
VDVACEPVVPVVPVVTVVMGLRMLELSADGPVSAAEAVTVALVVVVFVASESRRATVATFSAGSLCATRMRAAGAPRSGVGWPGVTLTDDCMGVMIASVS